MRIKETETLIDIMDQELQSLYMLVNELETKYDNNCKLDRDDIDNFFEAVDSRLSYYRQHIESETLPPCSKIFTDCDKDNSVDIHCSECMREKREV